MGKSFKLRILKLFQFCRPSSTLPTNPVPSSRRTSSSKCHVSSAPTHDLSPELSPPCSNHTGSPPETFHWQNEEEWHTVARRANETRGQSQRFSFCNIGSTPDETPRHKIYNSSASENDLFSATVLRNRRGKGNKNAVYRHRNSNSSAESSEERETLICSSRSFSTDLSSSEMNGQTLETILERGKYRKKRAKRERGKGKMTCRSPESLAEEGDSPARLSLFKRLVPCAVEGKVKESFAVVKKSEDPYEDFKRSMMEMILENKLFEHRELEELLQCFLTLNSSLYHDLIVDAFTEIWKAMFC